MAGFVCSRVLFAGISSVYLAAIAPLGAKVPPQLMTDWLGLHQHASLSDSPCSLPDFDTCGRPGTGPGVSKLGPGFLWLFLFTLHTPQWLSLVTVPREPGPQRCHSALSFRCQRRDVLSLRQQQAGPLLSPHPVPLSLVCALPGSARKPLHILLVRILSFKWLETQWV